MLSFLLLWSDLSLPVRDPVAIYGIIMLLILTIPILFRRLRLPHAIGLILAGLAIGPHGLNILQRDSSIVLFGTVGLLYIMFLSALEIDLKEFRLHAWKVLTFGVLTFIVPFVLGTIVSLTVLHLGLPASLLVAGMLSTHTLIAYPQAANAGLANQRSVTLTVGGTLVTDLLALIVLAAIAGTAKGEAGAAFWIRLSGLSLVYVAIVLLIYPRIIRSLLHRLESLMMQYVFVVFLIVLSAFLSELAGLEPIIGAFVGGLVLNTHIPHDSPLMMPIKFVGDALFIPFFLIGIGMLVDLSVFGQGWQALLVAVVILAVALPSKLLAARLMQLLFKLRPAEGTMMFGLSTARAAATLAIVLVGYNIIIGETASGEPIRLLSEDVLNGAVILILVSCTVGSIVVDRAIAALKRELSASE